MRGSTDLLDLPLNRWLDDAAIQQDANRVSCQVTLVVVVTDIDASPTAFHVKNRDGERMKTAESMMLNFAESGLLLRASSALERRTVKQGKRSEIHGLQR